MLRCNPESLHSLMMLAAAPCCPGGVVAIDVFPSSKLAHFSPLLQITKHHFIWQKKDLGHPPHLFYQRRTCQKFIQRISRCKYIRIFLCFLHLAVNISPPQPRFHSSPVRTGIYTYCCCHVYSNLVFVELPAVMEKAWSL